MLEPILDPRGVQKRYKLKLAPRCSMEDLRKGPILFYDNTKLSYAGYWEIYVRLVENLRKLGITNVVYHVETVRGKYTEELKQMGRGLVNKYEPKVAIVALGDMGTSPATAMVVMGIEEAGIPAVYITAPPGHDIVRGYVFYRAGQLCLVPVDVYQASTKEEIDAEVDKQMDLIIKCLTSDPKTAEKIATIDFKYDVEPPSADGLLKLSDQIKVDEHIKLEPGAYVEEITDFLLQMGIGDGLPIIPPTQRRYEKMLEYCPWDPEMIIQEDVGPAGVDITVKDIIIAAIMAGCKPNAIPVVVTAFQALTDPRYNFLQSVHTSFPGGNLVLVSGPIAKEVGLWGGQGCIGPGPWTNGPIGRAVNLVLINRLRCIPGADDLDCLASPAEFTYCFAEESGIGPWPTINEELYDKDTTTVLVLKAENPHDIIEFMCQTASDFLVSLVDCCTTLGSNNAYMPSSLIVVLTPDHAKLLAKDGWTKQKLKEYIHTWVANPLPMIRNRGLSPARPKGFENKHPMPVTRSPDDIWIVVAGGRGGHSAIIIPWGLHSEAVVRPMLLPNGERAKSIENFKRGKWKR
jgi:hypothetical protein